MAKKTADWKKRRKKRKIFGGKLLDKSNRGKRNRKSHPIPIKMVRKPNGDCKIVLSGYFDCYNNWTPKQREPVSLMEKLAVARGELLFE